MKSAKIEGFEALTPLISLGIGDARNLISNLPKESIDCVVTSPPYYGLRDYGDPNQIGMESTVAEYTNVLGSLFDEISRVLKSSGTVWLNLGDSYCGYKGDKYAANQGASNRARRKSDVPPRIDVGTPKSGEFKVKDLMLIPARVAIALQDRGWYLRSEIIWRKPNATPESVCDRPTNSHEKIYLLTKSPRYFYNTEAVKQPYARDYIDGRSFGGFASREPYQQKCDRLAPGRNNHTVGPPAKVGNGASLRNVWDIPVTSSTNSKFRHQATFPESIPRLCIMAGCPPGGVVLDPFAGSGTTLVAASSLGCRSIGIELNPEYAQIIRERNSQLTIFDAIAEMK